MLTDADLEEILQYLKVDGAGDIYLKVNSELCERHRRHEQFREMHEAVVNLSIRAALGNFALMKEAIASVDLDSGGIVTMSEEKLAEEDDDV